MKIGIITITNGQNYGNRLQNYALQEILKLLGHKPETIWNNTGAWENLGIYSRMKYWIRSKFHLKYTPRIDRVTRFTRFNRKFIKWSKYRVDSSNIPRNLAKKYDYFICGSDQIWNPFYKRTSEIDFLTFVKKEKKMAYAASLGVDKIEKEHEILFQKYLREFPVISVREKQGAFILEELLKREVPVMPDPTILLERTQWDQLQKKPNKIKENEKYILTYFLGENQVALEDVRKINKKYRYRVIHLEDCYTSGKDNPYFITMDPSEFVWLIAHAQMVVTDSFHGCVFSILYEKNFLVYPREFKVSLGSRIQQLLEIYQLEDHMAGDNFEKNIENLEKSINVNDILEKERKRGIEFLKKGLVN